MIGVYPKQIIAKRGPFQKAIVKPPMNMPTA
jgi:hypothetical protein